jgi:hypothetical protein
VNPGDEPGSRLSAGDVERRERRIEPGHLHAAGGEHHRERPGPTADIEHRPRGALLHDAHIGVEVAAIGVENVVQVGKSRHLEAAICHDRTVTGYASSNPRRQPVTVGGSDSPGASTAWPWAACVVIGVVLLVVGIVLHTTAWSIGGPVMLGIILIVGGGLKLLRS